jgi:choline dehydrogenase
VARRDQYAKVLMQSGIGDASELHRFGIPVVQDLPGVGANFQEHPAVNCVWEYQEALAPHNNMGESTLFWASEVGLDTPDLHLMQVEAPASSPENAVRFGLPDSGWSFYGALVRPKNRGCLRLAGPNPQDPMLIQTNFLSDPYDLKALIRGVELSREIGNSAALRPFTKREVMPGNLKGAALEEFIREGLVTVWHETCTAKMGRDSMSWVVPLEDTVNSRKCCV